MTRQLYQYAAPAPGSDHGSELGDETASSHAGGHVATAQMARPAASVKRERANAEAGDAQRIDQLTQIVEAYNQVTEKLQHSHDRLLCEVTRLRQELASADAQLQRSRRLAALGEMAAGIAHEIRNPLAAIQLYAGMIAQDLHAMTDQQHENKPTPRTPDQPDADPALKQTAQTAEKIVEAVRGLNGIVHDVLAFSREMQPNRQMQSVVDLFNRAVEASFPQIDAAAVEVMRGDLTRPQLTIHGDGQLLHQALLNLIRNAVEAMAQGPMPRLLTLDSREDGEHVWLIIRDTGPGIEQADIDRIFNPFFTTRNTGTGLGLAIVHRIVEVHDGAIVVHNDDGAVFELSLPMKQTSDVPREADGTSCNGVAA